jgi:Cupin domain
MVCDLSQCLQPRVAVHQELGRAFEDFMSAKFFPDRIQALPPFEGPFDAFQLAAQGCDVLFASYPGGTTIDPHSHDTENCGVITEGELILITNGGERRVGPGQWYHLAPGQVHAARFEVPTAEVEFWFKQ